MSATPLKLRHRVINVCLRFLYFGRVPVLRVSQPTGTPPHRPRLIIASHRNGAFDGQQVLAAFPHVQFLVSVQLLRNRFMRLLVAGIPVVRPKDAERYHLDPTSIASPVEAGCAHLRAGGDLGIFPEGSSEWGYKPQRYQAGAARIACTLADEGVEVEVLPVGLFYSTPDRFRSRAQVVVGPHVELPTQAARTRKEWEADVAGSLAAALDAVSVNCPDQTTFDSIQDEALRFARRPGRRPSHEPGGISGRRPTRAAFASRFLQLQGDMDSPTPRDTPPRYPALRWIGLALMWAAAPILGVAAFAGSKADARNTVTFFRQLGGFGASLVWIPVLIVLACFWPWIVAAGLVCAVLGWLLLGLRPIRL